MVASHQSPVTGNWRLATGNKFLRSLVFIERAHLLHGTFVMLGITGTASFSSQEGDGHAHFTPVFLVDDLHELFFDFFGISAGGYPNSWGNAHNVKVYYDPLSRDTGFPHDHVSGFSSNARKGCEFLQGSRDFL